MIATIHQPDFMPWIGFFDKIKKSDVYIILDDVQFSRSGWTHRDKFLSKDRKIQWLTVPIKKKGNFFSKISDVQIDYQTNWIDKHLNFFILTLKMMITIRKYLS